MVIADIQVWEMSQWHPWQAYMQQLEDWWMIHPHLCGTSVEYDTHNISSSTDPPEIGLIDDLFSTAHWFAVADLADTVFMKHEGFMKNSLPQLWWGIRSIQVDIIVKCPFDFSWLFPELVLCRVWRCYIGPVIGDSALSCRWNGLLDCLFLKWTRLLSALVMKSWWQKDPFFFLNKLYWAPKKSYTTTL